MLTCANGRFRPHLAPPGRPSVALLIRGFGVRVPGGAPVLTWSFYRLLCRGGGGLSLVVARWLLVCTDRAQPGADPGVVWHGRRRSVIASAGVVGTWCRCL